MKYVFAIITVTVAIFSSPAFAGARQERAIAAASEWRDCVISKAEQFSLQPEPAETLATAAMALCSEQEANVRHLMREATREYGLPFASTADPETLANAHNEFQRKLHDAAVAQIIQTRAARRP